MALFFDFPLAAPDPYKPVMAQWHRRHPMIALAATETLQGSESGCVNIFTQDGEHVRGSTLQRSAFPTLVSWHPEELLLACGWANGEIIVWNQTKRTPFECKALHKSAIKFITWSKDGGQFVSGDVDGVVGIWNCAKSGNPVLVREFKRDGAMLSCVFTYSDDDMAVGPSNILIANSSGAVYNTDGSSQFETKEEVSYTPHSMLYDTAHQMLVIIGENLMMTTFTVASDGSLTEKREAKLNGKTAMDIHHAGPGTLIGATNENLVRVWDLVNEEYYSLSLAKERGEFSNSDLIQTVAYDTRTHTIAAGSRNGFVYMWQLKQDARGENEQKWAFQLPLELSGGMLGLGWSQTPGRPALLAQSDETVSILRENIMRKSFGAGTMVVQVSSSRIMAEAFKKQAHPFDVDFTIKGVTAAGEFLAVWGAKNVTVCEFVRDYSILRVAGSFPCETNACAIRDQTIFTAEGNKINCRNFQGASKQLLSLNDSEGTITHLSINGPYLAGATSAGLVRLWDLTRREPRPYGVPKNVKDVVDTITDIQVNVAGSKLSYTGTKGGKPVPKLWVWDIEGDVVSVCEFSNRAPLAHFWDTADARLLVAEVGASDPNNSDKDNELFFLFATPDEGIPISHTTTLSSRDGPLTGVAMPFVFLAKRPGASEQESGASKIIATKTMRDFVGLENADKETASAMMDFSYHLTLGNMDEAFKAVRLIKSDSVWENMARMCVTTKRLDVATICMGNMGNAVGARALREAAKEPEIEARVASLAIQLGMYKDAEDLYKQCNRHDLLNKLYQDRGMWDDALDLAKSKDRVHLRNTCYAYAKHLESIGRPMEAAEMYERADVHVFEVPRLLFDDPAALEAYVNRSKNKKLLKWWAQYLESSQQMEQALKYYSAAEDTLSLVRVYCYCGNMDQAKELVDSTNDRAAAYHLARQYENQESIKEAIEYFSKSEMYNNAIRLAKEYGMKQEMLSLALRSTKADKIEAAIYYEEQGAMDKAVTLYHKGGRVGKALELCFKHNLYQALAEVSEDLDQEADPELLERAANFFMDNNQMDRAVNLLLIAKKYDEAIKMCEDHRVVITEDMAEKMTLSKEESQTKAQANYRKELLERVADCCAMQGSYQLATKKYTQAGNRVKAMRALLKSGDTEKIMYFATKCRDKEIYVMAANYLQSLDWRRDQEIMKNIIQFYTKGKALDSLASFYDACAQLEIDDYQNYDKALGALTEALKCMSKAKMKDFGEQETRVSSLQARINMVKKFCGVRGLAETNPEEMLQQARLLLQEPDIETAIRIGDVYGLMIEYQASQERYSQAYELMQEMRQKIENVNIAYYVNMRTIETVHRALDIPLGRGLGAEDQGGDDDIPEDL
eukprot:m.294179 g.294179  ORF g.294179 m.294179 type:complete len:1361 (-) comp12942_c0_seq1:503-4585(-)